MQKCNFFTHTYLWIQICISASPLILGAEGLQGTHMDALNTFSSKLMTLTPRGGLWTFWAKLALCAAAAGAMLSQNDIAMHGLSTFIISVYMASTYSAQPTRVRLSRASWWILISLPSMPGLAAPSKLVPHMLLFYIRMKSLIQKVSTKLGLPCLDTRARAAPRSN